MSLSSHYIYYKRNGTTYSIKLYTSISDFAEYTSHYIAVNIGGITYYAPSHVTSNSNDTYLRYKMNGSTYIVKNGYSIYQIPAGTYSPIAFAEMIKSSFGISSYYSGTGSYIQRTFNYSSEGTHFIQNGKSPASGTTLASETVRIYSYGSSPFHYFWLTGHLWRSSTSWVPVAFVSGKTLYGIGLTSGGISSASIIKEFASYPITVLTGFNITS